MITIVKQNHLGQKTLEYPAEVLVRGENWVSIIAPFSGTKDRDLGYVVFRVGDTFIEWHYADRWYNVFEVYDVDDGHLKGYYCNVTRPAIITEDEIRADDMALDVWVKPDRTTLVLDEDEFAALNLSEADQQAARAAVATILQVVAAGTAPFEPVQTS